MRTLTLLIIFYFSLGSLSAQTRVGGKVTDTRNKPIEGATITIRDSYDGTTADSSGRFSFLTEEKGEQVLVISAVGYKSWESKVTLQGKEIDLQATIREEPNEMKAVVITAGSFEAGDKKRTTVLSSIDIVTTASANADITGAIKTLPGAQQVGEAEGLFVRGGTAAETRTYIDGTLVNNFFFSSVPNIAQRGRFSPFIFKGTVFSAGGYSALYGQALSSALILESIDMPDRSSANLGISPISLSAGFQKLSTNKKFSWGVNYGYTRLDVAFKLIPQRVDYFTMPRYHNADANFRMKTGAGGMLKYYGTFGQNRLGLRQGSIDTLGYKDAFQLANLNHYHNLSFRQNLGTFWKMQAGISYSNNKDEIRGSLQDGANRDVLLGNDTLKQKNFNLDTKGDYFNARLVMERRLYGLSAIRFGSEMNYSNDRLDYRAFNGSLFPSRIRENITAAFGEADVYLTNDLAAKLGARAEYSTLLSQWNLAPRASIAYKLGQGGQASFAYGVFYQSPERRYLPAATALDFSKATHYILQYQKTTNLTTFRVEGYYKKYDGLLKTGAMQGGAPALSNEGYGYARGFELFWRDKKSVKNFDYWLSYSFLDTKRDFLNYPTQLEPNFAAKHTANLVLKKFVSSLRTQFNANYAYATGRPFYNIRRDNANGKFAIMDGGRTIDYNSLSLSVNYLPNVFKKGAAQNTVFVLSVTNVLGSDQVFGYNYSYNGFRREAIRPPARTFVFIGAFISFGVDRTQDVINSNL